MVIEQLEVLLTDVIVVVMIVINVFPFFFSVVLGLGIVLENKLCIFCTIFIFGPF